MTITNELETCHQTLQLARLAMGESYENWQTHPVTPDVRTKVHEILAGIRQEIARIKAFRTERVPSEVAETLAQYADLMNR